MRLKLSRRAENDLADIRNYSVEQVGVDCAIAYLGWVEADVVRVQRVLHNAMDVGRWS